MSFTPVPVEGSRATGALLVHAKPLRADAFAPFGQVIELGRPGLHRRDQAALLDNRRAGALPNLAVARIPAVAMPLEITRLERHPHSSQTFIPTDLSRYLVVVCPSGESGDPFVTGMAAFVAAGHQAVNYDAGTWHHAMSPLDRSGEYLVLRWNDGSDGDVEFRSLPAPVRVRPAD